MDADLKDELINQYNVIYYRIRAVSKWANWRKMPVSFIIINRKIDDMARVIRYGMKLPYLGSDVIIPPITWVDGKPIFIDGARVKSNITSLEKYKISTILRITAKFANEFRHATKHIMFHKTNEAGRIKHRLYIDNKLECIITDLLHMANIIEIS